jgi:hypothetical protein
MQACTHCGQTYQGRNVKYCSDACKLACAKEALPDIAHLVRPWLGKMSYRKIAELISEATGRPYRVGQISRAVVKIRRADGVEAVERSRLAAELEAEKARADALRQEALCDAPACEPLPRVRHVTLAGAEVTLRAVSLPVVTEDEIRLGRAVLAGAERGLVLAEEKPKRKRKTPRLALVQPAAGFEV